MTTCFNIPLVVASQRGLTDTAEYFLRNGSQPDIIDDTGNTYLHHAIMNGNTNTVKILLQYGAKSNIPNREGKTAFDIAVEKSNKSILELFE